MNVTEQFNEDKLTNSVELTNDPWPVNSDVEYENAFENNFTRMQKDGINENGLTLPDHHHHLSVLGLPLFLNVKAI